MGSCDKYHFSSKLLPSCVRGGSNLSPSGTFIQPRRTPPPSWAITSVCKCTGEGPGCARVVEAVLAGR